MLARSREESEQRPTLTSSMVASIDIGSLSGYGYGPTLTSSVVARFGCLILWGHDNLLVVTALLANVVR